MEGIRASKEGNSTGFMSRKSLHLGFSYDQKKSDIDLAISLLVFFFLFLPLFLPLIRVNYNRFYPPAQELNILTSTSR